MQRYLGRNEAGGFEEPREAHWGKSIVRKEERIMKVGARSCRDLHGKAFGFYSK